MNLTNIAYCAGLFDGEGCVGAYLRSNRLHVYLALTNTDFRLPLAMYEVFGGHTYARTTKKQNHKAHASWYIFGMNALLVARVLLPYSIGKHDQLELLLHLEPRIRLGTVMPQETQDIVEKISELKHIDWSPYASKEGIAGLRSGLLEDSGQCA